MVVVPRRRVTIDGDTISIDEYRERRVALDASIILRSRGAVYDDDVCHSIDNMAFTLWTLFEATLLCLNAICILNEERCLAGIGWASWQNVQGFGEPPTVKSKLLHLTTSIRTVVRVPLIFFNILTIIVKLVLG